MINFEFIENKVNVTLTFHVCPSNLNNLKFFNKVHQYKYVRGSHESLKRDQKSIEPQNAAFNELNKRG